MTYILEFWCLGPIMKPRTILLLCTLFAILPATSHAETSWTTRIIKRGPDRQTTNSMPITQRPNRPFHFYGNTVRRIHYRGVARPKLKDIRNTLVYAVRR